MLSSSAPDDYITTSTELTVNSTRGRSCVNITLVDDELYDNIISFRVVLASNDSAVTLTRDRSRVSVNIHESDG